MQEYGKNFEVIFKGFFIVALNRFEFHNQEMKKAIFNEVELQILKIILIGLLHDDL